MQRRELSKVLLGSAAGSMLLSGTAQAQACTPPCFPQSDAERDASVTPVNYEYMPGDVRRYGATLDTATLTNWAKVGGDLIFPVAGPAVITAAIPLVSNSTITFAKGATIQTSTPNISLFHAQDASNIKITGGHFKQLSGTAGGAAYVGGVALIRCTYCEVSDCEFEGMQWAGVYLDSSNQCDILDNHCHDFQYSAAGDKSDICVYRNSSYNTVRGNRCFGGLQAHHGILVQDPGGVGTFLPQHNKVLDNWVGDHTGYGIAVYIGGAQNSYNQVSGNTVQNITGTYINGVSGTGIYCVGAGIGGLQVTNNLVRNCCSNTVSATNGPGGITIADLPEGAPRAICSGNTVEGMRQGSGILIVGCSGGAVVSGNNVRMPSNNNGSGPGGGDLLGEGIRNLNSTDVDVTGNIVHNSGSSDAFFSYASARSFNNVNVTGNVFRATSGHALRFFRDGSYIQTDCVISGNQLRTDAGQPGLVVSGTDRIAVTGNNIAANTGPAMVFNACTGTRVANNSCNTNGTIGATLSGACAGSNYEKSNRIPGTVVNTATGFRVEQLLTAVPASGNYVAGDTVWFSTPAAGAAPGAICTTSGAPGVWKAMAALSS